MTENVNQQASQMEGLREGLRQIALLPTEQIDLKLRDLSERIGIYFNASDVSQRSYYEELYSEVIRAFPERSGMLEKYLEGKDMGRAAGVFKQAENRIAKQPEAKSDGTRLARVLQSLHP
jgi:hypothetical protein